MIVVNILAQNQRGLGIPNKNKWADWPTGRNAHFAAVYGQRLCLLLSKISYPQNTMLPLFPRPGAFFIFTFFKQAPVFFGENVRCKLKRFFGDPPPIRKNLSVVK